MPVIQQCVYSAASQFCLLKSRQQGGVLPVSSASAERGAVRARSGAVRAAPEEGARASAQEDGSCAKSARVARPGPPTAARLPHIRGTSLPQQARLVTSASRQVPARKASRARCGEMCGAPCGPASKQGGGSRRGGAGPNQGSWLKPDPHAKSSVLRALWELRPQSVGPASQCGGCTIKVLGPEGG